MIRWVRWMWNGVRRKHGVEWCGAVNAYRPGSYRHCLCGACFNFYIYICMSFKMCKVDGAEAHEACFSPSAAFNIINHEGGRRILGGKHQKPWAQCQWMSLVVL